MKRTACLLVAVAFAGLSQPAAAGVYDAPAPPAPPAFEEGYTGFADTAGLRSDVNSTRARIEKGMTSGYDDAPKGEAPKAPQGGSEDWGCGGGCASGGCGCGCGCETCCCGCCDPCCRGQGFVGGAEVTWLKPHTSSGTGLPSADLTLYLPMYGVNQTIPLFDGTLDPDFDASYRLWLGYQRCDGLGWRVRYWEFDHGTTGAVSVLGQPLMGVTTGHGWDTYALDFEITDSTKLGCNWDSTLSFGLRYVEYDESRNLTLTNVDLVNPLMVSTTKDFSGIGPTSSIELRRQVSCNLNAFVNARVSILMGDEDNFVRATIPTVVDVVFNLTQRNDVKSIYEVQAGGEYVGDFCGGQYFIRGGWETQYWDAFGLDSINLLDDASVGFSGFFVGAGISR